MKTTTPAQKQKKQQQQKDNLIGLTHFQQLEKTNYWFTLENTI